MEPESAFEKAKYSYNNAVKTLNDKADGYRNPNYTDEGGARCVGSVPDNPYSEASDYFTSSEFYMMSYNGKFKNLDNNYNEDWNQLGTINARAWMILTIWVIIGFVREGSHGFKVERLDSA